MQILKLRWNLTHTVNNIPATTWSLFLLEAEEQRPIFLQGERKRLHRSVPRLHDHHGQESQEDAPVSTYWLTSWGGSWISRTGTDLQHDFGQIKQHTAVPWETPKKHHQYYCIGLSGLACPAPLKEGWIIVVTVLKQPAPSPQASSSTTSEPYTT